MEYYKYFLALACPIFLWLGFTLVRHQVHAVKVLYFMGMLYPIGKTLQLWYFGPEIIRWYLADIGFLASVALVRLVFPLGTYRHRVYSAIAIVVIACVISILIEIAGLQTQGELDGTLKARGDMVDIIIYLVTLVVVLYYLNGIRNTIAATRGAVQHQASVAPSQRTNRREKHRRRKKASRR